MELLINILFFYFYERFNSGCVPVLVCPSHAYRDISIRRVDDEVGSNTVVYLDQATPQSDDLKSICRGKTVLNVLRVY